MTHPQARRVREQALACLHLGSPMYGELLSRLADDLDAGGPTVAVLRDHERDPGPSGLALRLVGSLHRLVLDRRAPELAAYYPTVGGVWSSEGCDAVVAFLAARGEELRPLLDQPPQTNEVGRAAALLGGLLRATAQWPLPVRLWEIGASGGLNLQADRFRFTGEAGAWGNADSPVVLTHAWAGVPLPLEADLRVVERAGCDVSPVDVTTEEGRLTLTAYVWPDMTDRHQRLAGAIALARDSAVRVDRLDAATYVERLAVLPGHLTVLWHSVMWQYVPPQQQDRVTARLAELGRTASEDAPLVHLYAEPTRRVPGEEHRFWVWAQTWPGEREPVVLGRMAAHGLPVTWE